MRTFHETEESLVAILREEKVDDIVISQIHYTHTHIECATDQLTEVEEVVDAFNVACTLQLGKQAHQIVKVLVILDITRWEHISHSP